MPTCWPKPMQLRSLYNVLIQIIIVRSWSHLLMHRIVVYYRNKDITCLHFASKYTSTTNGSTEVPVITCRITTSFALLRTLTRAA
jgi:hypothetical protein